MINRLTSPFILSFLGGSIFSTAVIFVVMFFFLPDFRAGSPIANQVPLSTVSKAPEMRPAPSSPIKTSRSAIPSSESAPALEQLTTSTAGNYDSGVRGATAPGSTMPSSLGSNSQPRSLPSSLPTLSQAPGSRGASSPDSRVAVGGGSSGFSGSPALLGGGSVPSGAGGPGIQTAEAAANEIEISPDAVVPASLASSTAGLNLSDDQKSLMEDLKSDFLASTKNGTTDWRTQQRINDAFFKLYYGGQAFNAQHEQAYRESLQSSVP